VLAGIAFAAQDKYALKVPDGLAFADCKGYESWSVVAVSQTPDLLKVEVANPVMIAAYRSGVPGNDKPFPDGSKIAKIQWKPMKSTEAPFDVNIPALTARYFFNRKGQQEIPGHEGMGIRSV